MLAGAENHWLRNSVSKEEVEETQCGPVRVNGRFPLCAEQQKV